MLSSKPLCLMLSRLSPLHTAPALCHPSLSFFVLLVQMQKKSIIIFSLLKFSSAELKMRPLSQTRQMRC